MTLSPAQSFARDWIAANGDRISADHMAIWHLHEPAWREYRSAAWYVERLRAEGFTVENPSCGMPTAFIARYGEGGPVLGAHAEYDAVPGQSQEPVPFRKPREGLHWAAAGHTDPHSALGIGALSGMLAAKAAKDRFGLPGTLVLFGEPAEKVCGAKAVHALNGAYDGLDAMLSFHPHYLPGLANSVVWDTHCGCYWSKIYTFTCFEPESWLGAAADGGRAQPVYNTAAVARAPGATDALVMMYTVSKLTRESMLTHDGRWTLNEAILAAGDACADNHAPRFAQIQYAWRVTTLEMAERIERVLDQNAAAAALATHCRWRADWVAKVRHGIPNHALARFTMDVFRDCGPPSWGEEALGFARRILGNLGLPEVADPLLPEISVLQDPEEGERQLRRTLPEWQRNYTSDDYTEYTWHVPTVRLFVGRPMLRPLQPGFRYPDWARNAMGGVPAMMDPMICKAGEVIGSTLVGLMQNPCILGAARAEFAERTGGGHGGSRWVAPLLPAGFRPPIDWPWPEYVETVRGHGWNKPMLPPGWEPSPAASAEGDAGRAMRPANETCARIALMRGCGEAGDGC
ncbi:amidohydrolase [Roseomonas sp. OT10]|uniref:M20/M25/M40 family metallo-hydrolase n=1 Tax=Roseomonas cutis TaxID=2897332 RepID=UPI001E61F48C|nr:M20/M25/M40 family metallo-hydrolase [Roseomonas sp. OT10]UFN48514.1 amidohydrolase [Roseomonas sp. OT10]